jgi:hypothetical protein
LNTLDLSRDGKHLAFLLTSFETDLQTLHIVPVSGGESRELLRVSDSGFARGNLEWTLDDKQILLVKVTDLGANKNRFRLISVSVTDGETRELGLEMKEPVNHFRLHPDGSSIAFTMGRRAVEVWAMENLFPEMMSSN